MKVSKLYTYPIKSLRGVELPTAHATQYGFLHDRTFMLLKVVEGENGRELKNMLVGLVPEMALFTQELQTEHVVVTFNPPGGAKMQRKEIPLRPDVGNLEEFKVELHQSPTQAYDMGEEYNKWFSSCFGYDVVLAYIGSNHRPLLGNVPPSNGQTKSWTSMITSHVWGDSSPKTLTFADVASYLIVTEESLDNVSERLPEGEIMDITKFRPNIVVKGSPTAWDEDFWGALAVNGNDLEITASCHRCQSINVDYTTGKYTTDTDKMVLKKLMKDRRVDPGAKHRPVFGRYGFFKAGADTTFDIEIGDEVEVTRRNNEHTTFEWPGLGNKK